MLIFLRNNTNDHDEGQFSGEWEFSRYGYLQICNVIMTHRFVFIWKYIFFHNSHTLNVIDFKKKDNTFSAHTESHLQ